MNDRSRVSRAGAILVILGISVFAIGCKKPDYIPGTSTETTGHTSYYITDSPYPYASVVSASIYIAAIQVKGTPGGATGYPFFSKDVSTDLLVELTQLRNGKLQTIASFDENYAGITDNEMKIALSSAHVKLSDGRVFDFPGTSMATIDIPINPPVTYVMHGTDPDTLIDFDLAQSIVLQGDPTTVAGITGVSFVPHVRAVNLSSSGSLSGTIKSDSGTPANTADDVPLEGAVVKVLQGGNWIATAATDSSGFYKVIGLPPGVYTISFEATGFQSPANSDIAISTGLDLDLSLTLQKI